MTTQMACPHVEGTADNPETVRLWDGRDHCRRCVEAACPGLVEYALSNGRLIDSIPYDQAGGLVEFWKLAGLFFGVLGLVGIGFAATLERESTLLLIGLMAFVLFLSMLAVLPLVFKARRVLPEVRVHEGIVEVFRPCHLSGQRPIASFSLSEARWHLGHVREDAYCRGRAAALVPNRPAVILRRPRIWKGAMPSSEFTATGSSTEMIRLWRGFLQLAGAPEGR